MNQSERLLEHMCYTFNPEDRKLKYSMMAFTLLDMLPKVKCS